MVTTSGGTGAPASHEPEGSLHIRHMGNAADEKGSAGLYIRTDHKKHPDVRLHNNGLITSMKNMDFLTEEANHSFRFRHGGTHIGNSPEIARITSSGVVKANSFEQQSDVR